nr:RhuM family protein [Desulfobacteraceae bacterium]
SDLIRKFRIVQMEGSREVGRLIDHYNLEMIIAVGFRVRSRRGSQFRKWANAELPNMGLTNWKGSRVLKTDIGTAKNYLDKNEIDTLNRITVMFLDQAEFRAQKRQTIQMADWENFLDKFLNDVELPVLENVGSIRREIALDFVNHQYDQFAERRRQEAQQKSRSKLYR